MSIPAHVGEPSQAAPSPTALAAVAGPVRRILQLEGFVVFAAAVAAYLHLGFSWWLFALLAMAPDLSFLAYLAGPRLGAFMYNAMHSYVGAIAIGIAGHATDNRTLSAVALIWAAHIGFDRMLGYGLKYASGFGNTHLGRIGRL